MGFSSLPSSWLALVWAVSKWWPISTTTPSHWLKKLGPVFQPMRSKTNTGRTLHAWFFPALWASYSHLLEILIGLSSCLLLLWLVGEITLILVFRRSFENRSIGVPLRRLSLTVLILFTGFAHEFVRVADGWVLLRAFIWKNWLKTVSLDSNLLKTQRCLFFNDDSE